MGVAMIARNAAETIGPCLDSIRPFVEQVVVCVDVLTTDDTAKVARAHGAEVHPIQISTWHECDAHGRVLAQHFARARDESFTYLRDDLDWWMWLDSDDVVYGADKLSTILPQLDDKYIGAWLPYWYSTINGTPNTVFHRERILRPRVGWEWKFRVHEVVKPQHDGPWFGTQDIRIVHQEGIHKTDSSAARNLLLLEIDLEETGDDPRTLFYIGNQFFAMAQWELAIEWYERLLSLRHHNPYERWQSAIYLSMAYERVGNLELATQSAFVALDEKPEHPEPYFRLACINNRAGRFEQVVWWTRIGRTMCTEPPFFVFKNPLDYTFNNRTTLGDALAQMGYLKQAREEWEAAYAVLQDPQIGAAIERAKGMELAEGQASDFVHALDAMDRYVLPAGYAPAGNGLVRAMYDSLAPEVRAFGRVRDAAIPRLLAHRPDTQPRVVFWCGRSMESWSPATLNTTGIGGSETAVVEIARRFAADGWRVDVYNGAGHMEGVYDDVGYWDPERYQREVADAFVSWRQPRKLDTGDHRACLLWCHDLNYGPLDTHVMTEWDRVLGVSQWHAQMLKRYYDLDGVGYVPNGINLERFTAKPVERVPMRVVYASSPDRGLLRLLQLWPAIVAAEPGATLEVAYGWDNLDKAIASGRGDLAAFKARVEHLLATTPGVTWHGRLPQDKLAQLYGSADAWCYPSSFLEVSCISAMEAMAGGAVPVASACGALRETIGDAGILIPGMPEERSFGPLFVRSLLALLTSPQIRTPLMYRGKKRAEELTWDKSYEEHWKLLVASLLEPSKELVCA